MDYHQYKRRPKRRVTGRFYAFLTVLVVFGVMLGVLVNTRARGGNPIPAYIPPVGTTEDPGSYQPDPRPEATILPANPQTGELDSQGVDTAPETAGDETEQNGGVKSILDLEDEDLPPLSDAESVAASDHFNARTNLPSEWRNILLMGSDTRDMKKMKRSRTDTMIIASINTQTGQIKLVSIMRDMMVEIPGKGMQKFNACTYYGGPELAMQVINENLGMNIREYAMVNFAGLSEIVDILDGVFVTITEEEMQYINRHIGEVARYTMDQQQYLANKKDLQLSSYGIDMRLSGMQAVTFARNRTTGGASDYSRTQNQRIILSAIGKRVKGANAIQLMQIASSMWGNLQTNIDMGSAVGLAQIVIKNGVNVDEIKDWRLPANNTYKSESRNKVAALWDVDYSENTRKLHSFIYGYEFD